MCALVKRQRRECDHGQPGLLKDQSRHKHEPKLSLTLTADSLERTRSDPRSFIHTFFKNRWAKFGSGWAWSQRIVIDAIAIDGEPYRPWSTQR